MPLLTRPWQSVISILKQFRREEMKEVSLSPIESSKDMCLDMLGDCEMFCHRAGIRWASEEALGFRGQEPWREGIPEGAYGSKTMEAWLSGSVKML